MDDILLEFEEAHPLSVSGNEIEQIEQLLENIVSENEIGEEKTDEDKPNIFVFYRDVTNNYYNNQTEYIETVSGNTVSDNILSKQFEDYTTGEGLLFILVVGLLFGGFVYLIRKAVYRWN